MKTSLVHVLSTLTIVVSGSAWLPGCLAEPSTSASPSATAEDETNDNIGEANGALLDCSNTACDNCVKHARCRQAKLPYGLFSCEDKKAIINAWEPQIGSVAIMDVGAYCHVGYVYDVHGSAPDAVVYVDEANYTHGVCGNRHGTENQLKIVGYFAP